MSRQIMMLLFSLAVYF